MAKEIKKIENLGPDGLSSYASYLANFSELVNHLCDNYNKQMEEENPEALDLLNIFCGLLKDATNGFEKEMTGIFNNLDNDSKDLLNRHIDNCGIVKMQNAAIGFLKGNKKKSKIELIIEIIKKIGLQLIDLLQSLFNFPAWLDKVIQIIVGLFEIIDNVLPLILELLGINPKFLKDAEKNLLEFHPMWRNLSAGMVSKQS